ncbi:sigma 54-interacting transcriptional regulator, partial [Pseudomonas aeruginosa]|nr:sigma 54-interacting transcriptional regulator [Pseudomonas aeruginosa]
TLFLDEIGELSLALQAKLLRVLQYGDIQRVGDDRSLRVDVRVLAATNRDLRQEVVEGRFRADLYHRLSVFPLSVPPLRERESGVVLLAGYFCEQCRLRMGLARVI